MDIRLIVVDLDGTLMQKDKTVSPRAQAAFARAREKGIRAGGGDGALNGGGTARRGRPLGLTDI